MMLWKKSKEKAGDSPEVPLGPWEGSVRDILSYYQTTRLQLVRLDKLDFMPLLKKLRSLSLPHELAGGLDQLRLAFEDARRKEVQDGKRYLGDLRQILWSSIDQVCRVLEAGDRQMAPLAKARQHLQMALAQSDLEKARAAIREVLKTLSQVDQQRLGTIQQLEQSFRQQMELLQSELQVAQRELQVDGLTQVYNRATFDQQLRKIHQLSYLTGQKSCLLMFDIDHFKKINDTFGHPAGDLIIQLVAKTIVQAFPRKSDFVARYGGEEFAVILQNTDLIEARELVAKLLVKIRGQSVKLTQATCQCTISAGIAASVKGETPEQWLTRADRGLYQAKQLGRDRFIIAEDQKAS